MTTTAPSSVTTNAVDAELPIPTASLDDASSSTSNKRKEPDTSHGNQQGESPLTGEAIDQKTETTTTRSSSPTLSLSKQDQKRLKPAHHQLKRGQWDGDGEKRRQEPHPGSYANPTMRELFGKQLPANLLTQTSSDGQPPQQQQAPQSSTEKRVKRKVAFLLGYVGTPFGGMQINAEQRTVQAELEYAMLVTHLLDTRNFGFPTKYAWSIAGRTDKGVHACAQVCSAKIEVYWPQPATTATTDDEKEAQHDAIMETVRQDLNAVLPPEIRVLDVVRTTRNFCAHTMRNKVRYQYLMPSFMLMDPAQFRATLQATTNSTAPEQEERDPRNPLTSTEIKQLQADLSKFRITPLQMETLKTTLNCYEGTHPFHNFTKGMAAHEARANRYIMQCTVSEDTPVLVHDESGIEWISITILGQSFLLHQIRKMVCMAMEVARCATPLATLQRALSKDDKDDATAIRVGIAPAQGLFLEKSYYEFYNKKKKPSESECPDIDWAWEYDDQNNNNDDDGDNNENDDESSSSPPPAYQRWNDFRNNVLIQHIMAEEAREGNFVKFLYIQEYLFDRDDAYHPERRLRSTSSVMKLERSIHAAINKKTENGSDVPNVT